MEGRHLWEIPEPGLHRAFFLFYRSLTGGVSLLSDAHPLPVGMLARPAHLRHGAQLPQLLLCEGDLLRRQILPHPLWI